MAFAISVTIANPRPTPSTVSYVSPLRKAQNPFHRLLLLCHTVVAYGKSVEIFRFFIANLISLKSHRRILRLIHKIPENPKDRQLICLDLYQGFGSSHFI